MEGRNIIIQIELERQQTPYLILFSLINMPSSQTRIHLVGSKICIQTINPRFGLKRKLMIGKKGNAPQNLMDTQVFDLKSQLMDASDSQAVLNRQK